MKVHEDRWLTVYAGDNREVMRGIEPESVHAVVTSPPYWGLRDYGLPPSTWADGWEGCLGLEPTPGQYAEHMVEVFREVRRVLRKDGTVWLNLGDSYATGAGSYRNPGSDVAPIEHGGKQAYTRDYARAQPNRMPLPGLKPKDRVGIPHRVVFALQADGWWWRDEIVWHKPNPMPSSVTDRTTPAHEMVFMLSRSSRYHYETIREERSTTRPDLLEFGPRPERGHPSGKPDRRRLKVPGGWDVYREMPGIGPQHGAARDRGEKYEPMPTDGRRNKRSVWTVATEPYPGAHFATFPTRLIEPMILAGVPEDGVVLDPFGGSGTVGLVAQRLRRRAVLIDLNPDYLEQALERTGRRGIASWSA